MADNNVYIPAKAFSVTVNAAILYATTCEYAEEAGEFDVTNLQSPVNANGLLAVEVGSDTVTTRVRGTVVVPKTGLASFSVGVPYDASLTITGEQTHSGKVRLSRRTKKGGVKGGYMIDFEGTFTAAVSGQ